MEIEELYDFIHLIGRLKTEKRFSTIDAIENDTVAAHSFRLTLITHVCSEKIKDIDTNHAIKLAMYHDIVESITGDVDQHLISEGKISPAEKKKKEKESIKQIKKYLPEKTSKEIEDLWNEFEEMNTKEACLVKALDKIETMITVTEHGETAVKDPEHLGTYGNEIIRKIPEIKKLQNLMKKDLKKLFEKNNFEWKPHYEY